MFWPFNKWTTAPTPWGRGKWNAPVESRESSFAAAKTHEWPKYAARFERDYTTTPVPQYWVSPSRPYGAISKNPGHAMQAMADADAHLRGLAEQALMKHAAGIALTVDEGRALMQVHLPPVSVPRERSGPGVVPDWDVPFRESAVPDSIRERYAQLMQPMYDMRRLAVGREIERIEQIKAIMERDAKGHGRPGRGRGPR